jgi:hypothetical protein
VTQDETWFSTETLKLTSSLSKINLDPIDDAVKSAPQIFEKIDLKTLSADEKVNLGTALALSENPAAGYKVLIDAAMSARETNRGYYDWIGWRAGWAAWLAGNDSEARTVFDALLKDNNGKKIPKEKWEYGQWVAAWFQKKIPDEQLVNYFIVQGAASEDDPYFLFGERLLKQKKYDDAKKAYERCVELAKKSGDTFPANWAKWRIKQMEGK